MKRELYIRLENQTIKNPGLIEANILAMGCDVVKVTMEKFRNNRSNKQNRYYWGVVIPHVVAALIDAGNGWLSEKSEDHRQMIHEMLCERFLDNSVEIRIPGETQLHYDEVYTTKNSTRKLNTLEMEEYTAKIRVWLMDIFGYFCPEPERD